MSEKRVKVNKFVIKKVKGLKDKKAEKGGRQGRREKEQKRKKIQPDQTNIAISRENK